MDVDEGNGDLRPEIALAWRRAALTGLDPGMEVRETAIAEVDRRSRLAIAAAPVLDTMIDELADSRFSVLLADRTSRIIDRRIGPEGLSRALDRVLAVPGSQYLEEYSGTNSLATAYELQQPIAVTGEEHYLEALKVFCCYGAPIIHPITRRLEGVLDVSGPANEATTLLGPFLMRAVRDVQQRMLEGARQSERRLLAEFQTHSRNKANAVLVVGDDLVLGNQSAMDMIHHCDHATLRALASDVTPRDAVHQRLKLSSGLEVMVHARAVPDSPGGVLFELAAVPTPEAGAEGIRRARRAVSTNLPAATSARVVLIVGEPGTGRTTTGSELAGEDAVVLDAALAAGDDEVWLGAALEALRAPAPVLIDNIHTLASRLAARLTPAVRTAPGRVYLTSSPLRALGFEHAALAAEAIERTELRPVRMYQQDFAGLALSILKRRQPGSALGITPSALRLLSGQPWPGNIRQLGAVLEYAGRGRERGDITVSDLPDAHRSSATRPLTLMETAERDAIVAALRAADGNKVVAAGELGIGRTTLYDRLRRYNITE